MIGEFNHNLYKERKVEQIDINRLLENVTFDKILTDEQRNYLDKAPTIIEFDEIINTPKEKKSPGLDGLQIEFYRKFWTQLREPYYKVIKESWEQGILPNSTRTSVLSTLHKAESRKLLPNYRPLSLTNCDYKLITFLFAKRLNEVLSNIISFDQVSYIKERYIGTSIRNLIDLFEYCEENNEPGAFLCMDFEKAFDSVEHIFLKEVLKKFNFGDNYIRWFDILYNDAKFKVKNNGWISKSYNMTRGLRQGCALSALNFLLVVEVLAQMIRQSNDVIGINVSNNEHKIIQYADDITVCIRNLESIRHLMEIIKDFGKCSGLKLNLKKTKGIWLGPLKDLGYRRYCNITWTGNPVKCLGIYLGHNKSKCYQLNWNKRICKVERVLQQWSKRKLTLFGKVQVIKEYALSKIVFAASILNVPEEVTSKLKSVFYYFLWGKRDKIKRKSIIRKRKDGGLAMVDLEKFFLALKAAWVDRLQNTKGKWADILKFYVNKTLLPLEYWWKTNFRKPESFPIVTKLPDFLSSCHFSF